MEEKNKILIFPIIVIICSIIAIIYSITIPNYFSMIISIIGIIGGILFLKSKKSTNYLLEFWLIGQVPYITKTNFTENGEFIQPIIEASQGMNLPFYLHFTSNESILYLGINFLPIIIIGILKFLKLPYEKSNN